MLHGRQEPTAPSSYEMGLMTPQYEFSDSLGYGVLPVRMTNFRGFSQ